ncbi:MAG: CehA/McbA family metallohydrolase, partial [Chloroflexota bacterium]|nr:CehA/McbA family metallohydrolase [Chloroflexota bacterium]
FMALTDHSNWYSEQERARMFDAARAANQPGEFLALVGFEWTHLTDGHANVFLTADDASRDRPDGETLAAFYTWLASRPQALATFNHPFPGEFDDFAPDPAVHAQFMGLEVVNGAGSQLQRFEQPFWHALQQGWRIGALGNLDTETPDWGADGSLRTGILLHELTEDALFDALRARRTFATEDANLAVALKAGDVWMGSEAQAGPLQFSVLVSDPDNESLRLELMRDGLVVFTWEMISGALPQTWSVSIEGQPGDIYIIRAIQADGDHAWSSPLWVTGDRIALDPMLTEVLSAPQSVDWDGDGEASFRDEWIELHNPHEQALPLAGWQLEKASHSYTFPAGARIEPGQYLVLYQRDTNLSLSNYGETIYLRAPDDREVDVVEVSFQGYDRSKAWCNGQWQERSEPSPGAPCHMSEPTPGDEPTSGDEPTPGGDDDSSGGGAGESDPASRSGEVLLPVAEVRLLQEDHLVTIEGIVTATPGTFSPNTVYIQDDTGGIKIFRSAGLEPLALGDRVRLTGYTRHAFGEWEISVPKSQAIELLGKGQVVTPQQLAPGTLHDHPGELVQVTGTVEGWSGEHWTLDDGLEPIFVYHDRDTGVRRPYLVEGETRSVVGIVGWSEQGPRLMPRMQEDLEGSTPGTGDAGESPGFLPTTGAE